VGIKIDSPHNILTLRRYLIIKSHHIFFLAGLFFTWVIFGLTLGKFPFSDEGSICLISNGLNHGLEMYRDFFNEKFPLVYYWSAFVTRFTFGGLEGARLASVIPTSLTIGILFYVLSKATKNFKLLIIFSILILCFFVYSRSFNASTESPLGLIYLLILLCIYKSNIKPKIQSTAIGSLMGIAFGFRQFAIIPFVVLLFAPWHRTSRIYYIVGFILSMLTWFSYFLYHGLTTDFYNATLHIFTTNPNISKYAAPVGFLKGAFLCIFLIALLNYQFATTKKHKWLILFALSCSATFFIRYGNFRLWPAFVVLLGLLFISKPKKLFHSKNSGCIMYVILLLAILLTVPYRLIYQFNSNNTEKYQHIVDVIKKETTNDQRVLIYPFDPNAYCLSERLPASKHYFMMPWTINDDVVKDIIDDINSKKAKLIVVTTRFTETENLMMQSIQSNYSLKKYVVPIPEGKNNYLVFFRND